MRTLDLCRRDIRTADRRLPTRAVLGVILVLLCASAGNAQSTDLRASQMRLDSIRAERQRLQGEMTGLQNRVRDESRELANLANQRAASAAALQEMDLQAELLVTEMETTQAELDATRFRLRNRGVAMRDRLRSIYKRGPLHTVRVLLGADDFADLLNRYKYLHLLATYDMRVIEEVGQLEQLLDRQEQQLQQTFAQIGNVRAAKAAEVRELQRLETRSRGTLNDYRQQESRVATAIDEAERAEARLSSVIADLEARRRATAPAAPDAISTRELGTLNWPVEGNLIYRFGPTRKPSGITLVTKGIGIAAPVGTPVRAIEAGEVVVARPFEGYGRTVMVSHGGGYYTLYMYLKSIVVQEGQRVAGAAVVGTVGGEDTPEGPHLYFQVHAPIRGSAPEPVDPLTWLRSQGR